MGKLGSIEKIEKANGEVIDRILRSKVFLTDVSVANKEIPFLKGKCILHSGPPLDWADMRETMQSAICGALVYEGWAPNLEKARQLADSGAVEFSSAHSHSALGPMAGIISPSMPVLVYENQAFKNKSFVTINEGLGKTLRFGANDQSVIKRLKWIERVLGPMLKEAIALSGPINVTALMSRGIQRGDECHNRNKASTGLFIRNIAPWLVKTDFSREDIAEALSFMDGNDHFFLNLSMGISKATMDPVVDIPSSTIVTCMATNGVNLGIKVAGLGNQWILGPIGYAEGNYFKGFSKEDASTVMGDSYISEAAGIGGFAMAAAPGICSFIGLEVQDAINYTLDMYKITVAEHSLYKIPLLGYRGTPLGIDIRKVLDTGILPIINTGIAHKKAGIGQIGAGTVRPPMVCFKTAASQMGLSQETGR